MSNASAPQTFNEYLTVAEAAEFLGVSPWTLRNWDKTGKLKPKRHPVNGYRIYRQQDLELILQSETPMGKRKGTLTPAFDWNEIKETEHFVQFYETDAYLVESVSGFVAKGLSAGEGIVVIATRAHRNRIQEKLEARGLDLAAVGECGQCIWLDAEETLSGFMVDGSPDPDRFKESIGGTLAKAGQDRPRVRAFGEMVALLWAEGNRTGAHRLEQLWNELAKEHSFALFCAYPISGFGEAPDGAPFTEVCGCHTRVIPAESYASLYSRDDQLRVITVLQQKAQALEAEVERRKEAERELSDFVENAPEGLHTVGSDGKIIWANKAELDLLGYEDDEYIGHHIAEFHADQELIKDILRRLQAGEQLQDYKARLRCKDGSIKHVLINSNVLWQDGEFLRTRCFTRDITERKRAEQRLETQHAVTHILAKSATLIDAAPRILQAVCDRLDWQVGVLWHVEQHKNVLCCADVYHIPCTRIPQFEAVSRQSTFEPGVVLPGRLWVSRKAAWISDLVSDGNFPRAPVAAGEGLRSGLGLPIISHDKVLGVMEFFSHEIRQPDEDLLRMMTVLGSQIGQFIERKRAEEANATLAAIVESSDDAIISKDLNSVITSWNSGAERIFGYTAEEAIGRPVTMLMPLDRVNEEPGILERIRRGERIDHYETVRQCKDGTLLDISLTVSPVFDGSGKVVGASKVARDITKRKAAEKAVRLRSAQYETLLNQAPLGVYLVDADFRIRDVNPIAQAAFGIPELIGQNFSEVMHILWEDEYANEIVRIFRKTLETGEPYFAPERIETRRDCGKRDFYEWQINRIILPDGRYGVVCYFRNISTQVQAREALKEVDRRKDEFLATLAHELRNPLAPIRNSLQILRMTSGPTTASQRIHDMMDRQVAHMVRLVDDLLELSRISRGTIELKKEPVELAAVISNAIETSRPMIEAADHQLSLSLPSEPIFLEGDMIRLSQVFANLLNNAAKYTNSGGNITVSAKREARQLVVSIRDTGIGIPRDMLSRVFDIFTQVDNSLRRSQDGLGIGLNLVRTIVSMHGGSVEARSDGIGRGSEFLVRLPVTASNDLEPKPAPEGQEAVVAPTARILVVDDNRDAADSLAMLLKLLGADVHQAYDGPSALEALSICRPSVVLLDIGMPGMDGYEVAKRVRRDSRFSNITLIALTGWGQDSDRRHAQESGFDHHLVKPVDFGALQVLLASLDGQETRGAMLTGRR